MKKLMAIILCLVMAFSMVACTGGNKDSASGEGAPEEAKPLKVGFAFYNLSNPVWAELVQEAVDYGKTKNMEVTYVDAGQDTAMQISQVENFIQSGMDAIVILAIDAASVEDICKKAMDAGIWVVDYSRGLENCFTTLSLDPEISGPALVKLAEPWIREKYGDKEFEWAHLDIPSVEIGVIQGKAIERTMLEVFPNSKLVFNGATLTVEQGQKNTENLIQANPNVRVILSQSAGGGVGGNEAIKSAAKPEEFADWGLFSIDATEQEVMNIINTEPQKGSISLGGGALHGKLLIDCVADLEAGKTLPKLTGLPPYEVTAANGQQFFDDTYKK